MKSYSVEMLPIKAIINIIITIIIIIIIINLSTWTLFWEIRSTHPSKPHPNHSFGQRASILQEIEACKIHRTGFNQSHKGSFQVLYEWLYTQSPLQCPSPPPPKKKKIPNRNCCYLILLQLLLFLSIRYGFCSFVLGIESIRWLFY